MNRSRSDSRPSDGTGGSRPQDDADPALWRHPEPVGYGIGFTSFATIAAPLLAGFSLTTIVTLSGSQDNRGTRGDIAIAAFSVTTVLMLFTLQAGIAAIQRAIPPDQRASQYPEARRWLGWMRDLRADQWRDEKLAWRIYRRCRWAYNLGIIAFIGGLIVLIVPSPAKWDPHTGPVFRTVALVVAAIAILSEIVLSFRWPAVVSRWLVPGSEGRPVKLKDVKDEPDDLGLDDITGLVEAQRLAFGDDGSFSGDDSNVRGPATASVGFTSALYSLATRLADLNQTVDKVADAAIRQTETTQAQLTLARQDFERRLLAAVAMRRANIEVTGPGAQETGKNPDHPSTPAKERWEERWEVLNRGPAIARGVRLQLPPTTAEWLRLDVHLLGRKKGPPPEEVELGDLEVDKPVLVPVSKVDEAIYPVSIVLHWTDDDGPHKERRSIGYTNLP
jgi:hypothetical protein